jgi:LysM repeat protein
MPRVPKPPGTTRPSTEAKSASVEVSEAREEMFADVSLSVADKYVKIRQDSDGENRVLEIESTIYASVKVNAEENLEILEDAHIINKNLNVSKTPIKYPKLICRNKNQATLKEIVTTSLDVPEALQIYRVSGSIRLDDVKVLEDKVSAEGSINAHILFVAESDDAPLYSYSDAIPFKQLIETKGSKPGDEVIISANVDRVNFNMLSGRETELRFLISFNTQIISENELSMITDIDISDMTESYLDSFASITVYCAQKNDSLWNIAKRYNTTIEEIMSANGLTSEILSPGQKIIILKKVSA